MLDLNLQSSDYKMPVTSSGGEYQITRECPIYIIVNKTKQGQPLPHAPHPSGELMTYNYNTLLINLYIFHIVSTIFPVNFLGSMRQIGQTHYF